MEITSFNPIVVSKHAEDIIALLEELGFERKHRSETAPGGFSIDLVNADGFRVDVAQASDASNLQRDLTMIRMNVRGFDEAYQCLLAHGFTNTRGNDTLDTGSAKEATMVSPTGFRISLIEHIR